MNFLFGQLPVNKRQLVPTLIHDDTTRIIVISILLLATIFTLYRIVIYYDR
jgi:hypothetical protein